MGEDFKKKKAKIIHKYEYEKDWLLSNYVPAVGEIVFYKPEITETGEPDYTVLPEGRAEPITYTRQKNGDGVSNINVLPFANKADIANSTIKYIKKLPEQGEKGYLYVVDNRCVFLGEERLSGDYIYFPLPENGSFEPGNYKILFNITDDIWSEDYSFGDALLTYKDLNGAEHRLTWSSDLMQNQGQLLDISVSEFINFWFGLAQGSVEATFTFEMYDFNKTGYTEYLWGDNEWDLVGAELSEHPLKSGEGVGSVIIADDAGTYARGKHSLAQGYYVHASNNYSHAEGNGTYAIADAAHAEGHKTYAEGTGAHAEGTQTRAKGMHTHTEGVKTVANAKYSHAEGNTTETQGVYSHSEGLKTTAAGEGSHIEGTNYYTFMEGYNMYAPEINATELSSIEDIKVFKNTSVAVFNKPLIEKVWAVPNKYTGKAPEWRFGIAAGKYSHAEGENTLALGQSTHVEGHLNIADNIGSHAEGIGVEARGKQSHAEGSDTQTQGVAAHSEGCGAVASGKGSHAEGIYSNAGGYIINDSGISGGSDASYIMGDIQSDSEEGLIIKLKNGNPNHIHTNLGNSVIVKFTHNNYGFSIPSRLMQYDPETKLLTLASTGLMNNGEHRALSGAVRLYFLYSGAPSDNYNSIESYEEDNDCSKLVLKQVCYGDESSELLIGTWKKDYFYSARILEADWSNKTKTTIVINKSISDLLTKLATTIDKIRIFYARDTYQGAHAEGYGTWARGKASHSEGLHTRAEGYASHTEGCQTIATADYAHAGGMGTIADESGLTVVGKYNIKASDRNDNALFVVGNGYDDKHRYDAFRVLADGTIITPYITIGQNGLSNKEWKDEKWILFGDSLTASTKFKIVLSEDMYSISEGWDSEHVNISIIPGFSSLIGTMAIKCLKTGETFKYHLDASIDDMPFIAGGRVDNYMDGHIGIDNAILDISEGIEISFERNIDGKRYFELISEKTGINIDNKAISGTGYVRQTDDVSADERGTAANNFYNVANTLETNHKVQNIITIFGSGNDLMHISKLGNATDKGTDTICGCINTTIDNIYAKQRLAKICIVTPTPWKGNIPSNTASSMAKYTEKLLEICKLRGIKCLDLFHESGLRPEDPNYVAQVYAEAKGVHLNDVGHKIIASKFKSALETLIF